MGTLNGKVALVTGASKGIGAGIARRLASDGARVVVNYASAEDAATALVADIEANGGAAVAVRADVRNKTDVDALVAAALSGLWCFVFSRGDLLILTFALMVLVYIRHWANLQRIKAGTEPKIGAKKG